MFKKPDHKRIISRFEASANTKRYQTKAVKNYLAVFALLTEDEKLQLVKMFGRSQNSTIIRGMEEKDTNILVPNLGTFAINEIRAMFVDNKEEFKGMSREERKAIMYERFGHKFKNYKPKND